MAIVDTMDGRSTRSAPLLCVISFFFVVLAKLNVLVVSRRSGWWWNKLALCLVSPFVIDRFDVPRVTTLIDWFVPMRMFDWEIGGWGVWRSACLSGRRSTTLNNAAVFDWRMLRKMSRRHVRAIRSCLFLRPLSLSLSLVCLSFAAQSFCLNVDMMNEVIMSEWNGACRVSDL